MQVASGLESWSVVGGLAGARNGWLSKCSWDCGGDCCSGDAESTGGMSDATVAVATGWGSAAVATAIEVRFEAVVVEVNTASPEEPDCEGAGAGAPPASAINSSKESDVRSTVEGILDCLRGKFARKEDNDLLALEAMRSI